MKRYTTQPQKLPSMLLTANTWSTWLHAASVTVPLCMGQNSPGPDLSPEGNLREWTEDDFVLTLRSGTTPDGRILDSEIMPWPRMSRMSDLELKAIWRYLQTV